MNITANSFLLFIVNIKRLCNLLLLRTTTSINTTVLIGVVQSLQRVLKNRISVKFIIGSYNFSSQ